MVVFSLIAVSYLEAGFSLHCRQLLGEVVFSLIDVSYLERLAFLFIVVNYL